MKKIFVYLVMTIIVSFALVACGSDDSETLVMGTSADYPPYESFDTATGEIVGFDIDIARYITDELGYELEIEDMDFNSLIPALESGRIDFVLAGMTPDDERSQSVDFSDIYYLAKNLIVTTEDSDIHTMEDLEGKTVAVQLGSIQEQEAEAIADDFGFEVVKLNRIPEIVQELLAGRIDAILMEDKVAEGFLGAQEGLMSFEVPVEDEEELGAAIAFPKESKLVEPFNEKLNEMMENGKMNELILEWFDAEDE
ncbi:transporter substrate-binding domain-containing protein [Halalkalibacter sp. APA_J-10(15)]|uniref:transporter substrate-binding domain-containing protein n=1 Tax=unclassified Halalkalibacter TaxID=2893063 RepID=UPI001FF49C6A|nr:transporter substrate-binding domain-containing protein [Halalkalibacter sp. APA_J-10(15)]MCK0471481.1 transporter substrate-binding domain-containing protein [Halalkalibacter sp. APA_J-10(15)]